MRAEQEEHRLGDGKVGLRGSFCSCNFLPRANPSQRQVGRQTGDMEEPPGCKTQPQCMQVALRPTTPLATSLQTSAQAKNMFTENKYFFFFFFKQTS